MATRQTTQCEAPSVLAEGAHCRYEGDQFPWGHCVVLEVAGDLVSVDLDHVGVVSVPVGNVTVVAEPDLSEDDG